MVGPHLLVVLAAVLLSAQCAAKTTSFWPHIQAIEARSVATTVRDLEPRNPPLANGHSSVRCTHPMQRVSWYTLTDAERASWTSSFRQLSKPGKSIFIKGGSFMDDLTLVHIGLQEELHYNSCFLPCHSAFLRAFYSLMRVSGYQGREAYWDIEHDWTHGIQNAALWTSLGGDDGKGGPIPSGPFVGSHCGLLPNTKKPGYSVYKPHPVTRHFNGDWNAKPLTRGDMYTAHFTQSIINTFLSAPDYATLRRSLEDNIHAWLHQAIGGEMWLFSATCEPAFWLLHMEIDRIWRSWQHLHGTYFQYAGHRRIRHKDGSTEIKVASLDDPIDFYGLFEKVTVRDVMHPRRGIMCFRYDHLYNNQLDTGR